MGEKMGYLGRKAGKMLRTALHGLKLSNWPLSRGPVHQLYKAPRQKAAESDQQRL